MKKSQYMYFAVLLSIVFLVPNLVYCSNFTSEKQIFTNFGSISLPKSAYVVEYDFSNVPVKTTEELPGVSKNNPFNDMFTINQITMQQDNSYNNAFLLSIYISKEDLKKMKLPEEFKLSHDNANNFMLLQDYVKLEFEKVVAIQKKLLYDTKKLHKLNLEKPDMFTPAIISFDWMEIQEIFVKGQEGFKTDLRAVVIMDKIVISFYIKAYGFNVGDEGVAFVVLYAPDSERAFWSTVLDTSISETVEFKVKNEKAIVN